ncbi:TonB-dependent receptor [Terriglobus aquaticus]|uniref:Carboxypeptidase regulatory-like domain-containing protein n=1 Tax=Terriglobus aquaticus TaxID=940139 RepID=A0ABW9KHD4_9BACT|nr:TonB-dependent receptor [Terriglobus aquaticus]
MSTKSYRRAHRTLLAYVCVSAAPAAVLAAATAFGAAALLAPAPLRAQAAGTASVQGTVKDATGAAVPNAEVVYTNTETGAQRTVKSGGSGDYSIPNVPVGNYTIKVSAPGFTGFQQRGVLEVGNAATVDATLSVGSESQVVEVQAGVAALETETVNYKQVVDQTRINELPLNGRQATQLALITGGAVTPPANDIQTSKNYANSTVISIAGGQGNYNNYVLDGGYHTDNFTNTNLPFPFPDALREFSVESNSLPARNGVHPGALINAVTVSGTNDWHGSAFEFLRNNIINATNFFSVNTATGAPIRDTLKRSQFGGTFGGHVIKDKLFFFGGYQGTRNRQVSNATTYCLPTPAELSGDFSQMGGSCGKNAADGSNLVNPATGARINTTPGTAGYRRVDPTTYSQQSLNVIKMLPLAQEDPFGLVSVALPANNQEDQYIGRVDWNISQRHTFFTRYFIANYKQPNYYSPTNLLLTTTAGNDERVQTATIGDIFNISPNVVNTAHATWARRRDNRGPTSGGINATNVGVNLYVYVPADFRMSVTNGPSAGCGTCSPGFFNSNSEDFSDDVDYQHGKHSFAFGAEYIRAADNTNAGYLQNGQYTFNGQLSGVNNRNVGEGMIDFLTGRMQSFGQSRSQQTAFRQNIISGYGQDTWHVQDKLTLTYGLRYEPMLFAADRYGRGSTFDYNAFVSNTHSARFPNAPAGTLFPGDTGISKAMVNNRLNNFSPRVGLAYQAHPTTVVRVGGAIMYDTPPLYLSQRQTTNPPYTNEIDLTGNIPFSNPWSVYQNGTDPFPGIFPPNATATFPTTGQYVVMKPDARTPVIYQWTASLQQEFGRGWNFSANYLGNRNIHQYMGTYPYHATYIPGVSTGVAGSCGPLSGSNLPAAGSPCSNTGSGNTNARTALSRINPSQGLLYSPTFTIIDDHGISNYNGGIFTIQHRSGNFNFLGNYTWSKCMDLVDNQGDIASSTLQNSSNPRADYGVCGYDVRHIANITFITESKFSSLHGFAAGLANGWQIAPLVRMTSGTPINVTYGSDISLTGQANDRPNLVPGVPLLTGTKVTSRATTTGNRFYFNRAAFAAPATGTYGNLPRNFLRTPNFYDVDLSVSRNFNVYERLRLQIRLESFNVLNHPNLNAFTSATPSSSTFGYATGAADPRIFQLAGRFTF